MLNSCDSVCGCGGITLALDGVVREFCGIFQDALKSTWNKSPQISGKYHSPEIHLKKKKSELPILPALTATFSLRSSPDEKKVLFTFQSTQTR